MPKKITMNIRNKIALLYKEAVRVNKLFEAISNKYKEQEISTYDKNLINKYYGVKKLNSWSDQDLANFVEGLPETWHDFMIIISNETEDKEYNEVFEKLDGLIDTKLLSNATVYKWMKSRYIDRNFNESHNPSDVISIVDKYVSIKDLIVNKLKSNNDFLEFFKTEGYNIDKVSDPLKLSYDDMVWIINQYETSSQTSINTYNIVPKDGEYVAKVGEWNVWLPHTQETSAKIAGYDDITKEPHTEWCTARTKGSNLFYDYISDEDNIKFLFYIIKDYPSDDNDWISLGFEEDVYDNMVLITNGEYGGDTVNRNNDGLREEDLEDIFGSKDFNEILRICEEKMKSLGYKNPATEELYTYANNLGKFKKALWSRSYDERLEFIKIIQKLNPSKDILIESVKFMDLSFIIANYSKDFIREPAPALGGLSPEDYVARKTANEDPLIFLQYYSPGTKYKWFLKYIKIAFDSLIKKNLEEKLLRFHKRLLNDDIIIDRTKDVITSALKKRDKESVQIIFIQYPKFIEKENIDIIIDFLKKESPGYILESVLGMISPNILASIFDNTDLKDKVYQARYEALDNIEKIPPVTYLKYCNEIIDNDLFNSIDINKDFLEKKILIVAKNLIDEDPTRFLHILNNFKGKGAFNILAQLKPEAIKKVSEVNPYDFFTFFAELPESEVYIEGSIDKYLENHSSINFLNKFHRNEKWFYKVAEKVASAASKESPFLFLQFYGKYSWAEKHVDYFAAAKDKPYEFIIAYNNLLDKKLTSYAAKELVENSDIYSLIEFIKYCFLKIEDINLYAEYINIAFEKIIEKDLADPKILSFVSGVIIKIKNTPFIDNIFGKYVKDLFYKIALFNKSSKIVYLNQTSYYNIINCVLGVSTPEEYMIDELKKIINNNPDIFINSVKYRDDVNKKVDKLGGKSWIEYAQSIRFSKKQASNSIQNKLLKLSNFLKSNNLKEYNYLNYYIEK